MLPGREREGPQEAVTAGCLVPGSLCLQAAPRGVELAPAPPRPGDGLLAPRHSARTRHTTLTRTVLGSPALPSRFLTHLG